MCPLTSDIGSSTLLNDVTVHRLDADRFVGKADRFVGKANLCKPELGLNPENSGQEEERSPEATTNAPNAAVLRTSCSGAGDSNSDDGCHDESCYDDEDQPHHNDDHEHHDGDEDEKKTNGDQKVVVQECDQDHESTATPQISRASRPDDDEDAATTDKTPKDENHLRIFEELLLDNSGLFMSRHGVMLQLLRYSRDKMSGEHQQRVWQSLLDVFQRSILCLELSENDTKDTVPGVPVTETREWKQIISHCRDKCTDTFAIRLVNMTSQPEDICDNLQPHVVEKLNRFTAEFQMDSSFRWLNVSRDIRALESVLDTCISMPAMRPHFLPLSETYVVQRLSEFGDVVSGLLAPADQRAESALHEHDLSGYLPSVLCTTGFLLGVLEAVLNSIRGPLLPTSCDEPQSSILGLPTQEFGKLSTLIAAGVDDDTSCADGELMKLFSLLFGISEAQAENSRIITFFNHARAVFPSAYHKSFLDFFQDDVMMEGPLASDEHTGGAIAASKQDHTWSAILDDLRELERQQASASDIVMAMLSDVVEQHSTKHDEEVEVSAFVASAIMDIVSSGEFQFNRLLLPTLAKVERQVASTPQTRLNKTISELLHEAIPFFKYCTLLAQTMMTSSPDILESRHEFSTFVAKRLMMRFDHNLAVLGSLIPAAEHCAIEFESYPQPRGANAPAKDLTETNEHLDELD